jgi:predicted amidophosphoribosyltransferase
VTYCKLAATNPQRIHGNWERGFALDLHTTSSTYLGVDEQGHDRFENLYSELGALLNRLKYKSDQSVVSEIASTAADFLRPSRAKLDLIVPVPPSKVRDIQPVILMAQALGAALNLPVMQCVETTRSATPLKDVTDPAQRKALLVGLFKTDRNSTAHKAVLLFDDLFRSGSTMNAVTDVLLNQGNAARVYAFTITRTRSKR